MNDYPKAFNSTKATTLMMNFRARQDLSDENSAKLMGLLVKKYLNEASSFEKSLFNLDGEYNEWLDELVKANLSKSRDSKNSQ